MLNLKVPVPDGSCFISSGPTSALIMTYLNPQQSVATSVATTVACVTPPSTVLQNR